jgi:hypothetical protein
MYQEHVLTSTGTWSLNSSTNTYMPYLHSSMARIACASTVGACDETTPYLLELVMDAGVLLVRVWEEPCLC